MIKHSPTFVLTVTYGNRWRFLSRVADAVLADAHVIKFLIIDNGSSQEKELQTLAARDVRVDVIRLEKNIGSAGGFARGLEEARKSNAEHVLLLDDDIVPESGFVESYLEKYKLIGNERAVLCGNRVDIPGNEEYFMRNQTEEPLIRGTFFEVFSWKKVMRFLQISERGMVTLGKKKSHVYVPCEGFAYGGAFIPMDAIRTVPLPDKDLVLYYDDVEYSWRILRAGFKSYLCTTPILHDIDMSFGEQSQTIGLCNPKSAPFKTYYFLRNRVRVSIRNTQQSQIVLFLNVVVWMIGFCLLGMRRYGISFAVLRRLRLLIQAVYGGYVYSAIPPKEVVLP